MRHRPVAGALCLALCGMAAAQTPPVPAHASVQTAAAGEKAASTLSASSGSLPAQQQRLLDEADQLVTLAQQLKTEVNKTSQYTLSLNTLRRADDIEKLAKSLQKQIDRPDR